MVETNVKYIVTVIVGLVVAILVSVISPVFLPFSDSIKELITGEPDTNITSKFTFDLKNETLRKEINDTKPTIVSKSITFNFDASQNSTWFGPVKPSGFECSMDGAPFEDCISPKSYYDLQADAIHNFQVRAKGILGNVDTSPDKFHFNIMTSATVQGVIKENDNGGVFTFSLDSESSLEKKNYTTDSLGIFRLDGIRQGLHLIEVQTLTGNLNDLFFVPSGETIITKSFEIRNMSTHITSPVKEDQLADETVIAFENVSSSDKANNTNLLTANRTVNITIPKDLEEIGQKDGSLTLSLNQESRPSVNPENPFTTQVWLNAPKEVLPIIEKVIYNLHHTFNPPDVTSYTQDNNFGITFSNWGVFDIKVTIHFKTGETMVVILPKDKWIIL